MKRGEVREKMSRATQAIAFALGMDELLKK